MNSLAFAVLALSLVACAELPEPVAAPPAPVTTIPNAIVRPLPGGGMAILPECPGSVELHSTAPACLVGRDADTGYACFWRCQ